MEKIEVKGKVIGKGRPRFTNKGGFVSTYTPKSTQQYEETIKEAYTEGNHKNFKDMPIKMWITAMYKPPKSLSKKKQQELLGTYMTKKPDSDNIAKIVCDALNGVAYNDDKQIALLIIMKIYGEEDKLEIELDGMDI